MSQYFLIVSRLNGYVLDLTAGKKGGKIIASPANKRPNQRWRWDANCRLVNKLGFVADIDGKSKKEGAHVHGWKPHSGLNQVWRYEGVIKSKLNDLVIDVTWTNEACMRKDGGGTAQKWVFVPEYEWEDYKLEHASKKSQYFLIVSHHNGYALDLTIGKEGGKIVASPAVNRPNQHWRWDANCRLVNKLGFVADIDGKSKKEGAHVHGWKPHSGLNQVWRVEEGVIKSNLSDLVIDVTNVRNEARMKKDVESRAQKWFFVPEDVWEDFELVKACPNPLNEAQFWRTLADSYLDVIIGYDIDGYDKLSKKATKIVEGCADELDKFAKGTGVAGTVGGSAAVIGGGLALAGLLLAPVTGGVSLGLTVAGAATGVAGGVTSFSGAMINQHWEKDEAKKVKEVTSPFFRATLGLQGFLKEYISKLKSAAEFLKTPKGEVVASDAFKAAEIGKNVGQGVWNAYKVGDAVYTGVKNVKKAKQIKALVNFIEADYYAIRGAKIGLATEAAAPGLKIPLLGKTLLSAGTTGARALSGTMAVVGVAFGIWDIYGGAKKIKNGSELAKEFRKSLKELKPESEKLVALYKELQ